MKKILMMMLILFPTGIHADVEVPKDMPTIEALISLHKAVKSAEDDAMKKLALSYGEQSVVTKGTQKFNDVRTTLDTKLSNAHSYVLLAASLGYTANCLYRLIQEYTEFSKLSMQNATKKPMFAWYFTEANLACAREIKNIKTMYATLTASGINLMKASMDEKMDLVNALKTSIDSMRGIIDSAYCWASCVALGGFHYDYIWDILNSEVTDKIAEEVINNWNKV